MQYTIIHAGILSDSAGGRRGVRIGQDQLRLSPSYRIGREDVAEVFVRALRHPAARNTTFDAVWASGSPPDDWDRLFADLVPDA